MISEEGWLIKITEDQMEPINIKKNITKMKWEIIKMVNVRSEGLVREITTKGLTTLEETTVATLILIEVLGVAAVAVIVMSTSYQFSVRKIMLFKDLNILWLIVKEGKFLWATCLSV